MQQNSFHKIAHQKHLPPEHKKEVMNSVELAKLLINIADLFTTKQAQADVAILSNASNKTQNKH